MKPFNYFQPTEIRYGAGRLSEVGDVVAQYGKRCLLVTVPVQDVFVQLFDRVKHYLAESGMEVKHFAGVVPNPTTDCVTTGAEMAKDFEVTAELLDYAHRAAFRWHARRWR